MLITNVNSVLITISVFHIYWIAMLYNTPVFESHSYTDCFVSAYKKARMN